MSVALSISESGLQPGVFWPGSLPNDWRVKRLKFVVRLVSAKAAYGESDLPYMGLEHIESWTGRYLEDEKASPDGVVSHFEPGDVLLGKLRPYLAKVHLALHRGVCSTEALVLRTSEELLPEYLRYFLVAPVTIENINSSTYGSKMPRASWDLIGNQLQPLPPPNQQKKIAAFLDRKTAEIDALIDKKRRLLDRLAEKRTAMITRAVTKGLNTDAPMKDSGVEWLGEIPAHWSVQPVYTRYSVQLGKMLDERRISGDSLVRYLRNVDVQWDEINYDGLPEMDIGETEYERYLVQEGDLLVCEGGEIGRSAIVGKLSGLTAYQKALHRLRPIQEAEHPRYMFYTLFGAAKNDVLRVGGVSTISHLTAEQLRRFRFPTPPGSEQRRIANFLDRSAVELDVTCARAEVAIDRLYEYRSALITNAVTGQIKVA